MSVAFERLVQHFESRDWSCEIDSEREVLRAQFAGEVGPTRFIAVVDAEDGLFRVFGLTEIRVPEGARPTVAEFFTRANFGFRVGHLELDMADGEIRFHASSVLVGGLLDDEVIGRLIGVTLAMMDQHMPAVMSLIYANEVPEDALRRVRTNLARSSSE